MFWVIINVVVIVNSAVLLFFCVSEFKRDGNATKSNEATACLPEKQLAAGEDQDEALMICRYCQISGLAKAKRCVNQNLIADRPASMPKHEVVNL